jgi:hypothetical protein
MQKYPNYTAHPNTTETYPLPNSISERKTTLVYITLSLTLDVYIPLQVPPKLADILTNKSIDKHLVDYFLNPLSPTYFKHLQTPLHLHTKKKNGCFRIIREQLVP